jgi:hypothetical protein
VQKQNVAGTIANFIYNPPLVAMPNMNRAVTGRDIDKLTYIKKNNVTKNFDVHAVAIPDGAKARLNLIGQMRFDTKIVRNMFFISNINRLIRLKLSQELSENRNVLASSHQAVARSMTEYGMGITPNDVFDNDQWD